MEPRAERLEAYKAPSGGHRVLAACPAERFEAAELDRVIRGAVSRLSGRERTVLTLYYEQGMNLREIGLEVGTSLAAAAKVKARAIESLRRVVVASWPVRGSKRVALCRSKRRKEEQPHVYKSAAAE